MNVFRHHNITGNHKTISHAHGFKLTLEDTVRLRCTQQRLPAITTEGKKVKTSALLITDKPLRHDRAILLPIKPVKDRGLPPFATKNEGWGTHFIGWIRVGLPTNLGRVLTRCEGRHKCGSPCVVASVGTGVTAAGNISVGRNVPVCSSCTIPITPSGVTIGEPKTAESTGSLS